MARHLYKNTTAGTVGVYLMSTASGGSMQLLAAGASIAADPATCTPVAFDPTTRVVLAASTLLDMGAEPVTDTGTIDDPSALPKPATVGV